MDAKRILILHTSIGLGHKAIAENIGYQLSQAGHEVRLFDIKQVQTGWLGGVLIASHRFINNHLSFLWGWLYRWGHYVGLPFRVALASFNYQATKKLIDDFQPDLVIATQTTGSAVIAYLKNKGLYKNLFGIAFSDYHLHKYWLYKAADFYLANIIEQEKELRDLGVAQPIFICGMTLQPKLNVDRDLIKTRLSIKDSDKVVLIASGSLGTHIKPDTIVDLVKELHQQAGDKGLSIKVLMVCGKNQELYQTLTKQIDSTQGHVFGYYKPMAELYAITDLFLTKPGGLSIAEGLQWQLPMLITHWLPGQEEINYTYLQANHLVMSGPNNPYSLTPSNIAKQVIEELSTGAFKQSLILNTLAPQLANDHLDGPVLQAVNQMFHSR